MSKNNRTDPRYATLGLMSYVSDGKSSVLGVVEDVSESGVRVAHVTGDFDCTVQRCRAVINSPAGNFSLTLKPCWVKEGDLKKDMSIGFQIIDQPKGWASFVRELGRGSIEPYFPDPDGDEKRDKPAE